MFRPFKIQKSWKVLMLTYRGGVSDEGVTVSALTLSCHLPVKPQGPMLPGHMAFLFH